MSIQNPRLSIILPCYNPSDGWIEHLIKTKKQISDELKEVQIEWILSNDGSEKNFGKTEEELLKSGIPGVTIVRLAVNSGKGAALRAGVRESKGHFCIFTDYDFPFGVDPVVSIYKKLESGADIVMAIRKPEYFRVLPWERLLISRSTLAMNKYLLRLPQPDTQAGLKGFSDKGKKIFLQTRVSGFLYDTEFIALCFRNSDCRVETEEVLPAPGVRFSAIRQKVLIREFWNFLTIWFRC
jgi:glycosyltransferase involved in cell wall biosynthesis